MKQVVVSAAAIALVGLSMASAQAARETISIVGSSTVYPFATTVAERFGKNTRFNTPKIESTGSGGGLKLFCAGVGTTHPDITNASRKIKASEISTCAANGVKDIVEVKIGYDGIVMANAKNAPQFNLSRVEIFKALAKNIPGPNGKLIPNPNKTWKDVNPDLPAIKIEVLGPPPTSGTRDAFAELALGGGAKKFADLKALRKLKANDPQKIKAMMNKLGIPLSVFAEANEFKAKIGKKAKGKDVFKAVAYAVREDGAYIEAGENDNLIIQKLEANPNALGVFGYSFLDQNSDKVKGAVIEGSEPEFEAIANGDYPISRSLYFYVKKAHMDSIPGMREYLQEFTSDNAWGDDGYLTEKGLIPMPEDEREAFLDDVKNLKTM